MKLNKSLMLITSLLVLTPVLFGSIMWNELPDRMPVHWGVSGEANGWSSKPFAVFAMPALILCVHWICIIATLADRKNKDQNKRILGTVLWISPAISLFVSLITYAAAFDVNINIGSAAFGLLGIVFIFIGNYMPKIKPNRTIGIKIPWTLKNEENWYHTHRIAGKIWVAAGIICLLCIFIPAPFSLIIGGTVLLMAVVVPTLYSYLYYKKKGN